MHIHIVVAARPNFMKAAPLWRALSKQSWADISLIHTGQHYDYAMSDVFFAELGLPTPHINLGIAGTTHGQQTGRVLEAYERVLLSERPDLVIVCGDVNATPAAALAAVKLGIRTAHLEAGLRSFDRSMPEEINRIVTDSICDILWTPSPDADKNLLNEGVAKDKIHQIGNIMIDTLALLRPSIEKISLPTDLDIANKPYVLVTLHRPSNVDSQTTLKELCDALLKCATQKNLVFPLHPRTRNRLEQFGLFSKILSCPSIKVTEPLPYCTFMRLLFGADAVVTDSGGVQEETSFLGIPCLTLRENTERPITITSGTNQLLNAALLPDVLASTRRPTVAPSIPLWDGCAAQRALKAIQSFL